jgi:hypothetical protein
VKPSHIRAFIAALPACLPLGLAHGQATSEDSSSESQLLVAIGAKGWANTWQGWLRVPTAFGESSRDIIQTVSSSARVAVIPQLSVRYGDWFLTGSTLTDTSYSLKPNWGNSISGTRNEIDANAGYYPLPGLAISLGYKQLTQYFGGKSEWRGPTIGLSGTAGLGGGFSVYGTVGFGMMKADTVPDGSGKASFDANYYLSEAGLAYSFGNMGRLFRSVSLTMGYRAQTVVTKDYQLADRNETPATLSSQNVRDTTQGAALGLIAVF